MGKMPNLKVLYNTWNRASNGKHKETNAMVKISTLLLWKYYWYYSAVDKTASLHIPFLKWSKALAACYMCQLNTVLIFAEQFSEEHIFQLAADSGIVMKWKYWELCSEQTRWRRPHRAPTAAWPSNYWNWHEFSWKYKRLGKNVKYQLLSLGLFRCN